MKDKILQLIPADFSQRAATFETRLLMAFLIFAGFLIASFIVRRIIGRVSHDSDPQKQDVINLIGSTARLALIVFGFITAVGTLGINVSALVAGLGLTGFALGFAFRDALSNVLAGVMILMYHPFRRGDHVAIIGLEGTVTGIDLRYTTLQNGTKTFLIPNSILLSNAISLDRA